MLPTLWGSMFVYKTGKSKNEHIKKFLSNKLGLGLQSIVKMKSCWTFWRRLGTVLAPDESLGANTFSHKIYLFEGLNVPKVIMYYMF